MLLNGGGGGGLDGGGLDGRGGSGGVTMTSSNFRLLPTSETDASLSAHAQENGAMAFTNREEMAAVPMTPPPRY